MTRTNAQHQCLQALQLGPSTVGIQPAQAVYGLAFTDSIRMNFGKQSRMTVIRGIGLAHTVKCCGPKVYSMAMFAVDDNARLRVRG